MHRRLFKSGKMMALFPEKRAGEQAKKKLVLLRG